MTVMIDITVGLLTLNLKKIWLVVLYLHLQEIIKVSFQQYIIWDKTIEFVGNSSQVSLEIKMIW